MRVVADSHSLLYYLFTPDQLSDRALDALGTAEDTEGIVDSAATLGDLWYSSQKIGKRALTPGAFESLRDTVLDPESHFEVAVLDAETMAHLQSFPLADLQDPWDRLIVSTAAQYGYRLSPRTGQSPLSESSRCCGERSTITG